MTKRIQIDKLARKNTPKEFKLLTVGYYTLLKIKQTGPSMISEGEKLTGIPAITSYKSLPCLLISSGGNYMRTSPIVHVINLGDKLLFETKSGSIYSLTKE